MKRRQIIITGIFILTIPAAILLNRSMRNSGQAPGTATEQKVQVRKVKVQIVQLEDHVVTQSITGRVQARDRYGIYAEVPGRMLQTAREFREGVFFRKGEVLIRLDNGPESEALKARKVQIYNRVAGMLPDLKMTLPSVASKWERYLDQIDPEKPIPPLPEIHSAQEKLFVSARDILNQYYSIQSEEERMNKFVEYAPFSGQLTQAAVLPGSYVQPGQKLGELTGTGHFEMETSLPLGEMDKLQPGQQVALSDPSSGTPYSGKVIRVLRSVDERTQNGRIILAVQGEGLYHGQFLSGEVSSGQLNACARVPRSLMLSGDQLFVVKDGELVRKAVQPLAFESSWAYVKGLDEGDVLLAESSPSFQNGMAVQFDEQ